ncbi:MAG: cyclophilin-like fold protein [Bacteroidaceae bacterium]
MQKTRIIGRVRSTLMVALFLSALSAHSTDMKEKMNITIGNATFTATLEDNATTKALVEMLPMTLQMSELNGNEKYHYLSSSLPTDASYPGTIHAGDIMLYGSSCLVVFYKTFSTGYSYTKIGRIDNAANLADAVGSGNMSVTFEMDSLTGIAETKAMRNGNGGCYSLSGTRVTESYKGIFIKNGKKYR